MALYRICQGFDIEGDMVDRCLTFFSLELGSTLSCDGARCDGVSVAALSDGGPFYAGFGFVRTSQQELS